MRLILLLFLGFQTLGHQLSAQQVQFRASTDARQVVVDGVFQVRFTLENADGSDFVAPSFEPFEIVSGPSVSMSTTIVNGRRSQSRSYSFSLLATKTGKFTIPGATIQAGSQTLKSNTLAVEVVEGRQHAAGENPSLPTDEQVFLRMEIDTGIAYPGQQVRLDYKLYTTVNIRNYNTLKEDPYEDFFFRYVKDFTERAYIEVVDGVQYKVQTLKSLALFPQKSGTFRIDPLLINVGIAVRDERRSFFFNTRTVPKTLRSNEITIDVRPVPEPQPEGYTGAIGSYEMSVQVNRRELTTDDALVLTLQIQGNGDAKRWSPPSLSYLSDRFEMYDPKTLQDNFTDAGGYMRSTKIVEYLLIPLEPGNLEFDVEFTYFDVDSSTFRTLRSRPVRINVSPGSGAGSGQALIADRMQQTDISGLQSPARLQKGQSVFLFSPAYLVLAGMPLVLLLGALIIRRRRAEFAGLDAAERKRRRAMRTAQKHLAAAHDLMVGDSREFYEAISMALFSYISSKLKIPISELTKENLERKMVSAGIQPGDREAVMHMSRRCEMVLYAGGAAELSREDTYAETLDLLTRIERTLS